MTKHSLVSTMLVIATITAALSVSQILHFASAQNNSSNSITISQPGSKRVPVLLPNLSSCVTCGAPIAVSGNNLYTAWPNNDTGHWNVFFAKSIDGGKTFKTTMLSAPNKGHTIDANTQISAFGRNVYVTWWTNKTGTLMPVFRASSNDGDIFGKAITLNSTR